MSQSKVLFPSHNHLSGLNVRNVLYRKTVLNYLLNPLLFDLNGQGDITSRVLFERSQKIKAQLVAKQAGILAGIHEVSFFVRNKWLYSDSKKIFSPLKFTHALKDGSSIHPGMILAQLEGSLFDILALERTILNFLQHMSGVATLAHYAVEKCKKYPVLVCTTRKTAWGLLDKKAASCGGAGTHRLNLSDAILVKDTHLDLLGHDFNVLLKSLSSTKILGRFVEIEVETLADAQKAYQLLLKLQDSRRAKKLPALPCFIMLDNMSPHLIARTIRELGKHPSSNVYFEASGGINLQNLTSYAKTGVDVLSVGVITHSAPSLDISLKIG